MGKWDCEGRLKRHIKNLLAAPHEMERPKEERGSSYCFVAVAQPFISS